MVEFGDGRPRGVVHGGSLGQSHGGGGGVPAPPLIRSGAADETRAFRLLFGFTAARPNLLVEMFPVLSVRLAGPAVRGVQVANLLLRIPAPTLAELMARRVAEVLDDFESDWGDYWGLLEFLRRARLDVLFDQVLQAALLANDEDVRNAGKDWQKQLGLF